VWKRRIRCPWCGHKLRYGPRRKKGRAPPERFVDPAKYGVDA
jgi:DNA-directed RNA polymerase subunit RPC12/RpoP